MRKMIVFLTIISLLTFYSTRLYAQAETAGAAAGTAVTAGVTTGTIVAGAVIAAAAAAAIAASGGGGAADEIIPTKSAEQQNTENLQNNTSAATQSSTSQTALALNSTETANLGTASTDVLGTTYIVNDGGAGGGTNVPVTAGTALSTAGGAPVTISTVQTALAATTALAGTYVGPTGQTIAPLAVTVPAGGAVTPLAPITLTQDQFELYLYLKGLKTKQASYTAFVATLNSLVNRNSQDGLNALQNLNKNVESETDKAKAAAAVAAVLKDAATNYAAMMKTLLATLHPGYYAVVTPTVHHGGGNWTYVTTLHRNP